MHSNYSGLPVPLKDNLETLRGVNKIGAKLALTIYHTRCQSVVYQTKNAAMLSSVPSIGKKTAERMCLELKDKIAGELVIHKAPGPTITSTPIKKEDPLQLALAQLDYRKI